jgi:uncharacterized protein YjaZ
VGAYDYPAWFYGTQEIPRAAGYSIGYQLIRAYLGRHPDETAASLVDAPARGIVREARFCK